MENLNVTYNDSQNDLKDDVEDRLDGIHFGINTEAYIFVINFQYCHVYSCKLFSVTTLVVQVIINYCTFSFSKPVFMCSADIIQPRLSGRRS